MIYLLTVQKTRTHFFYDAPHIIFNTVDDDFGKWLWVDSKEYLTQKDDFVYKIEKMDITQFFPRTLNIVDVDSRYDHAIIDAVGIEIQKIIFSNL